MLLRKDDPWIVELAIPDIRNWHVYDGQNERIGIVETLAIESQDKKFEALYTGANERFPADEIEIGEGVVYISRPLERTANLVGASESVKPRFDDAFREHFEARVGEKRGFDRHLAAYRLGREMATDADFVGLSFTEAEEELRAHYAAKGQHPPYSEVRSAVQFGYELARGART